MAEFPIGTIIVHVSGAIPAGWQICDGTNGTPNLIGKFVRGASVDGDLRTTGGSLTHKHSNPDTSERAAHNHGGVKASNVSASDSQAVRQGTGSHATTTSHTHGGTIGIFYAGTHKHTVPDTELGGALPLHAKRVFIRRMA